ncbi:MAG TPA: AtpZ/AtpI family protein [Caulobacteraceae bacterium]|jgi:ATP synthase protein I
MPKPDESSQGALKRLDRRLEAFEATRAAKPSTLGMGDSAGDGFRLLGQLLGGVLGGLGLGALVDRFAHTSPFGIVAGLLIGVGLSVFAAVRTASAMSAREAAKGPPAAAVADDEDDEEGT